MKTTCQLYLFMHLFRFAASCRFFFAWQQTHWLNCYFCLPDASCVLKNQKCSNGKNNQLSVTFLSHRLFLVGCCLCFRCFSASNITSICITYPEISGARGRPDPLSPWTQQSGGGRFEAVPPSSCSHTANIFIYVNLQNLVDFQFRAVKSDLCYFLSLQVYIFKMIQCFQRTSRDSDYSADYE